MNGLSAIDAVIVLVEVLLLTALLARPVLFRKAMLRCRPSLFCSAIYRSFFGWVLSSSAVLSLWRWT